MTTPKTLAPSDHDECGITECSHAKEKSDDRLPRTPCSAVVTLYPTGCFGIDYQGSQFFWWGFGEDNAQAMLAHLRIPPQNVTWEERYYDRRYDINDPRCYRTREFIPQNDQGI